MFPASRKVTVYLVTGAFIAGTFLILSQFYSADGITQQPITYNVNPETATASKVANDDTPDGVGAGTVPIVNPPTTPAVDISYDLTTPPSVGCVDVVNRNRNQLTEIYTRELKGIRYVNMHGYLETENKGDAAIYTAQQMILAGMGITTMEACRFAEGKGCNGTAYRKALEDHRPYSAIMMAGGGNFNDFYWEDQPARIKTAAAYKDFPIRSFPQSIHMTKPEKIQSTYDSFSAHPDIQLAARDQPSYDWLQSQFGKTKVKHVLSPDVAFAWGDRSDIRKNIKKKYDVLILARDDWEITHSSKDVSTGVGELDLGVEVGKVSYRKVDWKKTPTPLIDGVDESGHKLPGKAGEKEEGKEQRAFAKAMNGFEMLAEARLVITDRLHGHILATVLGTPHILMDSKLKKNLNYHDTFTKDCGCTRVAINGMEQALEIAGKFFKANGGSLEKLRATGQVGNDMKDNN